MYIWYLRLAHANNYKWQLIKRYLIAVKFTLNKHILTEINCTNRFLMRNHKIYMRVFHFDLMTVVVSCTYIDSFVLPTM